MPKPINKTGRVVYQVVVKPELSAKIEELAVRLEMSRSQFLERLLEEGMKDNEWVIRAVTSPLAKSIKAVLAGGQKKPRVA